MFSATPSQNPFTSNLLPRKGETFREIYQRKREEARAKAASDAIDKQIKRDRIALRRHQKAIKVLLLGQSESEKSTVIKNFQLRYAHSAWVQERRLWKIVIYLNLIRSVTAILEIVNKAMKEQREKPQNRLWSLSLSLLSDDREPSTDDIGRKSIFNFSDKHRLLDLQFEPLTHIQRILEEYLDSAFEFSQAGATFRAAFFPDTESPRLPRRHPEFSEEEPKGFSEQKFVQDLRNTIGIFLCCGSDIKQLLADDVVQQVLKSAGSPLEHFGFSMDDIDRLLKKDYKPSDQDIDKVRPRTVGVQEYHFNINSPGYEDLIFYDVCGSRTIRHAWCSYFDNINSIVFLAPVGCFDQCLAEDARVNWLEDILHIWKCVCNSKVLANIRLILILNKVDLLKEKLESGVRFNEYVTQYGERPNEAPSVITFLNQVFQAIHQSSRRRRSFQCYLTPTTGMDFISTIQASVLDGVICDGLEDASVL